VLEFTSSIKLYKQTKFKICLKGTPQYIVLEFDKKVIVESIRIMFQGGFAGKVR
jgi:hypothetical protein